MRFVAVATVICALALLVLDVWLTSREAHRPQQPTPQPPQEPAVPAWYSAVDEAERVAEAAWHGADTWWRS